MVNNVYKINLDINPKVYQSINIDWHKPYSVMWLVSSKHKPTDISNNSLIVGNWSFLFLIDHSNHYLLLLRDSLLLVEKNIITVKLCKSMHLLDNNVFFSKDNHAALKYAKKMLRKLKRNEVYSLLPNEIFEKYKLTLIIELLEFIKSYNVDINVNIIN